MNESKSVSQTKVEAGLAAPAGTRSFTLRLPRGMRFKHNGQDSTAFDPDALALEDSLRFDIQGGFCTE